MKRVVNAIALGMSKDADIGVVKPSLLFDARNIRLTAREGSTLLSITNERSTKEAKDSSNNNITIEGEVLGYCILNENLIIFHTDTLYSEDEPPEETKTDYISVIEKDDSGYYTRKYAYGDLNFGNKIEAFGLYETANLKKVYWTDGVNQPRMFNIALLESLEEPQISKEISPNDVDFSPELSATTAIPTITKNDNAGGLFPAGVIQYVFTYYNVNGLLSAPFYVSPLHYITFTNRAGSPEETCNCTFTIEINNTDPNPSWDYIRIYRLVRTSINNTPLVEYLPDIKNSANISIIDNGVNSTAVTPTDLYYLGGDVFTCRTFTNKDAVLFCGNLEIETPIVSSNVNDNFQSVSLAYSLRTVGTSGESVVTCKIATDNGITITDYNYSYGTKTIIFELTDNNGAVGPISLTGIELYDTHDYDNTILPTWLKLRYTYNSDSEDPDYPTIDGTILTQLLGYALNNTTNLQNVLSWSDIRITGTFTGTIPAVQLMNVPSNSNLWTELQEPPPTLNFFNFELNKAQDEITYFKYGEFYRFGVQFKDKHGLWSNVVFLGDRKCSLEYLNKPASVIPSISSDEPYKVSQMDISLELKANNEISDNYVSARPVCVYPDISNMRVVALGIMCPTLTFIKDGVDNIKCLSDWFARPSSSDQIITYNYLDNPQKFKVVNGVKYPTGEIQIPANFKINKNICTIHSPEFEFNDSIRNIIENCTLFRIGRVLILNSSGKVDMTFTQPSSEKTEKLSYVDTGKRLINYSGFTDSIIDEDGYLDKIITPHDDLYPYGLTLEADYIVYPWSSESLSLGTTLLKQKWFSNIHQCGSIDFCTTSQYGTIDLYRERHDNTTYTSAPKFVDSINDVLYNLSPFGDPYYYKTNINLILLDENNQDLNLFITKLSCKTSASDQNSYLQTYFDFDNAQTAITYPQLHNGVTEYYISIPQCDSSGNWHYYESPDYDSLILLFKKCSTFFNKGVQIKYKSSNHVVVRLLNDLSDNTEKDLFVLCDLIRETDYHRAGKLDNDSPTALLNNTWIPCGEEVPISSSMTLHCTKGDTYYQRYEHLKTYPYDDSSMNNVVEIVSFPVETRINIQGRYDKRINITDHLYTNPTNFNLLNDVYSQKDNFFTYRTLDEDLFNTKVFPNQVVFSLKKNLGERIDTWTNISLASTLDLDGDKGELTALRRWLNKLLFFLKHGYGIIDYNERTVLNTSEGLPVLIANSGKVDGKIYLSTIIGCDKKETIVEGYDGLYFTDNSLKSVYLLSDIQGKPTSLTDTLGMKSWMFNKEINRSYYDTNYKDLYLMTDNDCLGYSEPLKQFTSFYDYKDADFLVNLDKEFVASANVTTTENNNTTTEKKLWELFKGTITENSITKPSYNKLFNIDRDYLITYRINGLDGATNNKIFDYIEYKGDIIDSNKATIDAYPDYQTVNKYDGLNRLFSKILVSNEYLDTGNININGDNTRKKFRVWRTIIPRNYNSRTRISNPWVYIKLTGGQLKLLVLHDMNVYYND